MPIAAVSFGTVVKDHHCTLGDSRLRKGLLLDEK